MVMSRGRKVAGTTWRKFGGMYYNTKGSQEITVGGSSGAYHLLLNSNRTKMGGFRTVSVHKTKSGALRKMRSYMRRRA